MRLLILLASACTATSAAPAAKPAELDARFVDTIRRAAAAYPGWGRVDAHANIAPGLCRAPLPEDYGVPSQVRRSDADDAAHGKKLYYLWTSGTYEYLYPRGAVPVGFTIVKQSFAAVPIAHAPPRPHIGVDLAPMGQAPPPLDTVIADDGHSYQTGAPKDLYVIAKVGDLPGSDDGYVYGTVAVDGRVTSAGRVASCMGCHEGAPRERLFGLKQLPPLPGATVHGSD